MLRVIEISSPKSKREWIESFDFSSRTWIVSDLKAKLTLQKHGLNRSSAISTDCVLRIGEVWRRILFHQNPLLRILPNELVKKLWKQRLMAKNEPWCQRPGATSALFNLSCQSISALTHPDGFAMMGDFFRKHPESYMKWGDWFVECHHFYDHLLTQGFIAGPWIAGYLLHSEVEPSWNREILIDVGADLTEIEAELLVRIARQQDVTVLLPHPTHTRDGRHALRSYRHFEMARAIEKRVPGKADSPAASDSSLTGAHTHYKKFTTMLAEVKDSVATIRQWVDEGASLSDLAIVAPDIGVYWPALKRYLDQEGIPTERGLRVPIQTFPQIHRWLSRLRIESGDLKSEDLESVAFAQQDLIAYDEFVTLFGRIYESTDLSRSERINRMFQVRFSNSSANIERDDAVAWALSFAEVDQYLPRIEGVLKSVLTECPQNFRLPVSDWLSYFENICAESEESVESGQSLGLPCLDLASAEFLFSKKIYFLGLSEAALNPASRLSGMASDVDKIESETGFVFPHPDRDRLEFEVRWLARDAREATVFSFPATDFQGTIQAPSLFWLGGRTREHVDFPKPTRWDEIQQAGLEPLGTLRGWDSERQALMKAQLDWDMGREKQVPFSPGLPTTLSASHLENYFRCPFIYAATRLFRLKDPTPLDLDLDPTASGILSHAIVEKLVHEEKWEGWTDEALLKIIDDCRVKEEILIADSEIWASARRKFLKLARRFLEFERDWRKKFPKTQTQALERQFEGRLDPVTGRLGAPDSTGISLRGKVDRIDSDDERRALVIDYKSGGSAGLGSIRGWLEDGRFQLALYTEAVEKGLIEGLEPHTVAGACYLSLKDMDRVGGFRKRSQSGTLFDCDDRRRDQIDDDEYTATTETLRLKIVELLEKIKSGEFRAEPADRKTCENCSWSRICRAPHLS